MWHQILLTFLNFKFVSLYQCVNEHRTMAISVLFSFVPSTELTQATRSPLCFSKCLDEQMWNLPWSMCCVPPKIHVPKPNPQGDGVRRQGLWKVMRSRGRKPQDGMSALMKVTPKSYSPSHRVKSQ